MPETSAPWFRENTSHKQPTPPKKGGGLHHHPFRTLRSTFCLLVLSQMNR